MSESRAAAAGLWALVVIAIGVLGYLWFPRGDAGGSTTTEKSVEERLELCQELMGRGQYDEARREADEILRDEPGNVAALLLAGEAAVEQQRMGVAMEYYRRVPIDASEASLTAAMAMATIEFYSGTLKQAERLLQRVLKREPTHAAANTLMAQLLDLEGRRWEVIPYALEAVRQGRLGLQILMLLADQEQITGRMQRMREANSRDKSDPGPLLGLSRAASAEGETNAAEQLTRRVITLRPDLTEAHVRLGEILLEQDPQKFVDWHTALPPVVDQHPDLWVLRGLWARRTQQPEAAARCFWEALTRNPNDATACNQLGQLLQLLERPADAALFLKRGTQLDALRRTVNAVYRTGRRTPRETLRTLAATLSALGRQLEADAWQALAGGKRSFSSDQPRPETDAQWLALWVSPEKNPALAVDLSALPMPRFEVDATSRPEQSAPYTARYEDLARESGIDFTYVPAPDESTPGRRIIESTGGGAAAFDFDCDGWPDLFLTQGGMYPMSADADLRDVLYRNLGDRFVEVSGAATLRDTDFGQGVAVGDVNADGFPDLFVGNVGPNRLFLNNGDGTFDEATSGLGKARDDWTTSAAFFDANQDGLPDLYVVNYLTGDPPKEVICRGGGQPTMCSPDHFEAEQDRFLVNRGDGTFEDVTARSGIVAANGKGLGILVADFDENGRPECFVANDAVPNFFFTLGEESLFVENAAASGVAIGGDGAAQGCMGIAAGDANLDGRLDFFVTNFDGESNALYSNLGGLFEDTSRQAGLREPAYRMVGFGTQFVDGELDGFPDLIMVNGHVDDFQGSKYRMLPQYMRNRGDGGFELVPADRVGSFFEQKQLGRAMARLDWDRDGREDLAVSHLDSPAALLTNRSDETGHFLALRLVGVRGDRLPVGATVRVHDGDWSRMQQQTAGDGYQSANESKLTFGLGERVSIPRLVVRWPDGTEQSFSDVPADREFCVVQGRDVLFFVPQ